MAIENLDSETILPQEVKIATPQLISIENGFQSSNIWLAGVLKLRCPFIDEPMILYGFIGKYNKMNIDDFKVNGLTIHFADDKGSYFNSTDVRIYPKVVADLKKSAFIDLFPLLGHINLTSWIKIYDKNYSTISDQMKTNYYFFESNIHTEPCVASDEIYLVCKYKKDEKTQYALLAPHEVMLEQ